MYYIVSAIMSSSLITRDDFETFHEAREFAKVMTPDPKREPRIVNVYLVDDDENMYKLLNDAERKLVPTRESRNRR